jgi:hypothetical protein
MQNHHAQHRRCNHCLYASTKILLVLENRCQVCCTIKKHVAWKVRKNRSCKAADSEAQPASTVEDAGLVFTCGTQGSWDSGAISNPVVRVFSGGDKPRWFLWYTGRGEQSAETDAVLPAAGKIGTVACIGLWHRGSLFRDTNRFG